MGVTSNVSTPSVISEITKKNANDTQQESHAQRLVMNKEPIDSRHFIITNQNDVIKFAKETAKCFDSKYGVRDADIQEFISSTYKVPRAHLVTMVKREERNLKPIIDICVYWSSPLTVDAVNREDIERLEDAHFEFKKLLKPRLDSLLHVIDPRHYESVQDFRKQLPAQYQTAKSIKILPTAEFCR